MTTLLDHLNEIRAAGWWMALHSAPDPITDPRFVVPNRSLPAMAVPVSVKFTPPAFAATVKLTLVHDGTSDPEIVLTAPLGNHLVGHFDAGVKLSATLIPVSVTGIAGDPATIGETTVDAKPGAITDAAFEFGAPV